MKKVGLKVETLLSLILNVILGALVFAWLDANASAAIATVAGVAVVALGIAFSFTFTRMVSGKAE